MSQSDKRSGTVPMVQWAKSTADLGRQEEPTVTVVQTVATVSNASPKLLPRLADVVDPDALNTLFTSLEPSGEETVLEFAYADCQVTVRSSGAVSARKTPLDDIQ